jgi:hypothetical protein
VWFVVGEVVVVVETHQCALVNVGGSLRTVEAFVVSELLLNPGKASRLLRQLIVVVVIRVHDEASMKGVMTGRIGGNEEGV